MSKATARILKETLLVDEFQSAAAIAVCLERPGYRLLEVNRRGRKAVVSWERVEKGRKPKR